MAEATLKQLIAEYKITADTRWGNREADKGNLDDWKRTSNPWTVTLRYRPQSGAKPKTLTVNFWTGSAIMEEPGAESVLESLLSDYSCGSDSFEDFCANCGYDTDSRKAFATYQTCERQAKKLKKFLDGHLHRFLECER